jgi:hypothetical protein
LGFSLWRDFQHAEKKGKGGWTMGSDGHARRAGIRKRKAAPRANSRKNHRAAGAQDMRGNQTEVHEGAGDQGIYVQPRRKPEPLTVKAKDGQLVIKLPLIDPPRLSGSEKSHVVASTFGVKRTSLLVEGLPIRVVASAFIYGYKVHANQDEGESLLGLGKKQKRR